MLNFEEVKKILPQRFPYLMIDKVIELKPCKKIVAIKNITGNEIQFLGHFPEQTVMPGTLINEAMAQAAIILFTIGKDKKSKRHRKVIYYLAAIKSRFLHPVNPGDQLKLKAVPKRMISNVGIVKVEASVDNKVVARAELTFSIKDE
jgi:3-hydroxyacyl-[acyl-carrier-protein] dehydratase